MRNILKIVDDFWPLPEELRACALHLPDKDEVYDGHVYHGCRMYDHPGFREIMRSRLGAVMGFDVEILINSFVVAGKGVETTQWIHADLGGGMGEYACVLHLHHQKDTGTAFWRHRATECELMDADFLMKLGEPDPAAQCARMVEEGKSADAWQMVSLAGAAFNRLVVYPSLYFHSRWPKDNVGDTPEESRIIWIAFFNAGGFQ